MLKNHVRKKFPYKLSLSRESLLMRIHEDKLLGNAQCDLEVPEELHERFAIFPPFFGTCDVGREIIGIFMLNYAERDALLLKPQRMLVSSNKLKNGIVLTPLLKIYLQLGTRCTKIHRFIVYIPQSISRKIASTVLYNLSLMQDEKFMKIWTLAVLLKL